MPGGTPEGAPSAIHAKFNIGCVSPEVKRSDAPQFLSICHVLEFEKIYEEEAKGREKMGDEATKRYVSMIQTFRK